MIYDSSVIISYLRGIRVQGFEDNLDIAKISTITTAEILAGAYLKKVAKNKIEKLKAVLLSFENVDFNATIAEITAELTAKTISKGKQHPFQDSAIAATAIYLNEEILTSDKGFKNLQELDERIKVKLV